MQQETINDNSTKKIINNTTRLTDTLFGVRTTIKIEFYSFHELNAVAQGTRYYVLLEFVRLLTVSARIEHGITYSLNLHVHLPCSRKRSGAPFSDVSPKIHGILRMPCKALDILGLRPKPKRGLRPLHPGRGRPRSQQDTDYISL